MEPDMDLRRLRYFVAVAERLHFGQAAAALHITQPALSRQIARFEREIGVELFRRTSRDVVLTSSGRQLLHDGRWLLDSAREARERALHATGGPMLTVGFMLGVNVEPTVRGFREHHPEASVRLQRLRWWNQSEVLLDGLVDIGFLRCPVPSEGLITLPLYAEPLTVALPTDHPLASRSYVALTQLAEEPVLGYADAPPAWNAFWTLDPRPDGTEPRHGPAVHDIEETVEYVRTGNGVAFLPASIAADYARPDIAYVPLTGAPQGRIVLAWNASRDSSLIDAFTEVARRTCAA